MQGYANWGGLVKELGCLIVIHLSCQANRPARTCSLCSQRTLCLCLYLPMLSSVWRNYWSSSAVLRRAKRQADYLVGTALYWYNLHSHFRFCEFDRKGKSKHSNKIATKISSWFLTQKWKSLCNKPIVRWACSTLVCGNSHCGIGAIKG